MNLEVGHMEYFCADVQAAKRFYTEVLGFEVLTEQGDGAFVWVTHSHIEILLRPGQPGTTDNYQSANQALVFYTEDMAKTKAELEAKGLAFKGTDGSDECLTFTDPDGHWFQLVNPESH